jgi:hypothetical protein
MRWLSPVLASMAFLLLAFAAMAQEPARAPDNPSVTQPAPPSPPVPSPPRNEPGFFDAVGRWFDQSAAEFKAGVSKMKSSIDEFNERSDKAAKEAAAATKSATEAMLKFPTSRMVEGRERCQVAANGSPDCRAAVEAICKAKGFASGNSLDTQTSEKCSPRAWLSRRLTGEGECRIETFVTRAACQ